MADPYATLGIKRGASEAEVKSAYRKLAKELHPDKNTGNPKAAERFSDVTRAYDLLSDSDKRARFDRGEIDADGNPAHPFGGMGGGRGGPGMGGAGMGGGFRGRQAGGFDTEEVDLGDLFEGLFGGGGGARGAGMGGGFNARANPGGGFRRAPPQKGGDIAYKLKVPFVDAATRAKQRITLSDGKTIDLSLPEGVEDGTQMRLRGKGQQGPGGAGDAIVTIEVEPHRHFERDGDNVRLDLPITLSEAVGGAKVRVPTVDGAVMLTVKPGTSGGTTLRLGGKGFSKKAGGRGDQLVRLEIALPADTAELEKRLAGWQDDTDPRGRLTG